MKLDKNWHIYQFHANFGSEYSRYFESLAQEHDSFDQDGETNHTLSSPIQHFENEVRNPISLEKSVISIVGILPDASFISLNQPASQTLVQLEAQAGTSKARVITVKKTVNNCTYCRRDYTLKTNVMINILTINKLSSCQLNLLQNDR